MKSDCDAYHSVSTNTLSLTLYLLAALTPVCARGYILSECTSGLPSTNICCWDSVILACFRYTLGNICSATPAVPGARLPWYNYVDQTAHKLPRWSSGQGVRLESGRPGVQCPLAPCGLFRVESYLKTGTPMATLPGAWRCWVSAGTGWPGVSIL